MKKVLCSLLYVFVCYTAFSQISFSESITEKGGAGKNGLLSKRTKEEKDVISAKNDAQLKADSIVIATAQKPLPIRLKHLIQPDWP
ncbi:MAG: hypothetical protein IPP48_07725 [Chitinophagaceae bacterium]|nr:hypothetical protein [Chitinophagaceae bacterium]